MPKDRRTKRRQQGWVGFTITLVAILGMFGFTVGGAHVIGTASATSSGLSKAIAQAEQHYCLVSAGTQVEKVNDNTSTVTLLAPKNGSCPHSDVPTTYGAVLITTDRQGAVIGGYFLAVENDSTLLVSYVAPVEPDSLGEFTGYTISTSPAPAVITPPPGGGGGGCTLGGGFSSGPLGWALSLNECATQLLLEYMGLGLVFGTALSTVLDYAKIIVATAVEVAIGALLVVGYAAILLGEDAAGGHQGIFWYGWSFTVCVLWILWYCEYSVTDYVASGQWYNPVWSGF